jgi:hypothetical protein
MANGRQVVRKIAFSYFIRDHPLAKERHLFLHSRSVN